jgi:hypothetical protein
VRLAHQATFGPSGHWSPTSGKGAKPWILEQLALYKSRYRLGGDDSPTRTPRAPSSALPGS